MESFESETRSRVNGRFGEQGPDPDHEILEFAEEAMEEEEENGSPPTGSSWGDDEDDPWLKKKAEKKLKKKKSQVFFQGYVEAADEDDLTRTKSLTDEDLEELKGCLDLGFGFSYEEIPELCNTLPALELCYSMSQRFLDEQQKSPESSLSAADACSPAAGPIANWKISSPGDHPEDVKARLKYWAQAVACTVRLCN